MVIRRGLLPNKVLYGQWGCVWASFATIISMCLTPCMIEVATNTTIYKHVFFIVVIFSSNNQINYLQTMYSLSSRMVLSSLLRFSQKYPTAFSAGCALQLIFQHVMCLQANGERNSGWKSSVKAGGEPLTDVCWDLWRYLGVGNSLWWLMKDLINCLADVVTTTPITPSPSKNIYSS